MNTRTRIQSTTPVVELLKEISRSTEEYARRKTPDEFPGEQAYLGWNKETTEYLSLYPTSTTKDSILSDITHNFRRKFEWMF